MRFHKSSELTGRRAEEYKLIVPSRYLVIKDDIPRLHLNYEYANGSEHPNSVPTGHTYDTPVSMHGEICVSEF